MVITTPLRFGSIGSSHEMPKLTSADKCLNLFFQLEAILSIVTMITVILSIFIFIFLPKGIFKGSGLLKTFWP